MKKIGYLLGIGEKQYSINKVYPQYIANAGFEPIAISPLSTIETVVELCDGLLLPGGKDLNPIYYGDDNKASINVDPVKDAFERKALHAFMDKKKPIFGICRGFQLIVREYIKEHDISTRPLQYLQGIANHSLASARDVDRSIPTHSVTADMAILYGDDTIAKGKVFVNSIHHQALISKAGKRSEFLDGDDILEIIAGTEFGVSSTDNYFIVEGVNIVWNGARLRACQWHPEELNDVKIIQNFFNQE